MNKKLHSIKYIISDLLSSSLAWILFYVFRKKYIESQKFGFDIPFELSEKFYLGLLFIPLFWLTVYYIVGYYRNPYRKSRLKELGQTLLISLLGVLVIFFVSILDDTVNTYQNYYLSFFVLLGIQFILTYLPRLIITRSTIHKIHNKKIGFNTIVVGSDEKAISIYNELESLDKSLGNKFIGFVTLNGGNNNPMSDFLTKLGELKNIKDIISEHKIEEVIIAIESSEHNQINKIIQILDETSVIIKVIPDMYDIITGSVKMSNIFGAPLIQISHDLMPPWQENLKRMIDVIVSIIALILLTPVYIFLSIGVKLSSPGPILYSHERIGRYGKPFTIYKFRSMVIDAEKHGPALSSKNDSRITKFGLLMRKSRLDEFPQFYNVLKGDMSLVGPRPERQHFIDLIVEKAPHYSHLQKVRPGITSWGQVKYGYAENVDQMIARLKYDILYIENMTLYVDFKILIYTVMIVLKAKGK
ncbi:MAG: polyprenyl glycosylphosphotransferase [Bacteroidetes bacterium GWA2_31_9]|nr:MAG: polyprenyl glycosylphosphotransferase [Bacteroidetes bacterium GWA2_31_9]